MARTPSPGVVVRRLASLVLVAFFVACGEPSPDGGSPDAGPVCAPGARACDGSGNAVVCNAAGSAFEVRETCAAGCEDGACKTCPCTPGDRRCEGRALMGCAGEGSCGTAYTVVETCSFACDPTELSCIPPPCNPNARRCSVDGTSIEHCDGTLGWTSTSCGPGAKCVILGSGAEVRPECVTCPVEAGRACRGPDIVEVVGCDEVLVEACDHGCELVDGTPTCTP